MRLLIVDDFSTMRRVLRGVLREMKIDAVDEAADGVAALEKLRGSEFDFVITDIGMPTMNGFELLSAIKKDERLRHLPVLMVTAEAKKDDIVRCSQGGAAGYIVKPFTRATLEEKLRRAAPRLFAAETKENAT
jgi:two-component system, chemotaxis family, chemotaxis protein CheY